MYCGKCGAEIADGAEKCDACGERASGAGERADWHGSGSAKPPMRIAYAGFWLRAVAFLIDCFLILLVMGPAVLYLLTKNIGTGASLQKSLAFAYGGTSQALAINLLIEMAFWLYFATLESSAWQATVGKKVLGLFVTDMKGNRISFLRASGRFLGLSLEHLTFFMGFAMAGFTAKKQALHDIVAGCLVLKKR